MPLNHKRSYAVLTEPGKTQEWDTLTCCHCQRVIHIELKGLTKYIPGGFCVRCNKNTCEACHQIGTCRPFEKWLEKVEAQGRRQALFNSLGL